MNRFTNVKTGAKRLQDHIPVSLISGLIALVGLAGFAAVKIATGT